MAKKLRCVALGDMHTGSRWAVADLDDDNVPRGGAGAKTREALFELWCNATQGKWGEPDVLVANGDLIDGLNKKSGGVGAWSTSLFEQADNACELLRRWKAKQLFVVRGSGYHVEAEHSGLQVEEYIARKLEAVEVPEQEQIKAGNRDRSGWEWYLHLGNITFHFSHKISVSKVFHYQTTPTARQMLQAKLNDRMRHEMAEYKTRVVVRCLSLDTEILTRCGWKNAFTAMVGQDAATINMKTGAMEWKPIRAVVVSEGYTNMVQVQGKGIDALVTPDHNMVCSSRARCRDTLFKREASELVGSAVSRLPVSGVIAKPDIPISDAKIKLLAWVIAEGNMNAGNASKGYGEKNNVRIYQRPSRAHEIEQVLAEAGVEYTKKIRPMAGQPIRQPDGRVYRSRENGVVFYLRQPHSREIIQLLCGEKNIPDWLMEMSHRQFELFLHEYIRGDGHLDSNGPESYGGKLFTSNADLADRLQALLVTNGYKSQIDPTITHFSKKSYRVSFVRKQFAIVGQNYPAFSLVPYTGKTWCISNDNGTIVIRRNGKVMVTGNSHAHYYNHIEFSGSEGYVLPCWKALDEFMLANGPLDISPDIGFVGFEIEEELLRHEKNLWQVTQVQRAPFVRIPFPDGAVRPGRVSRATRPAKRSRAHGH